MNTGGTIVPGSVGTRAHLLCPFTTSVTGYGQRCPLSTAFGDERHGLAGQTRAHTYTHTHTPVLLFHRSSNTPSADIKSVLEATEGEGQTNRADMAKG